MKRILALGLLFLLLFGCLSADKAPESEGPAGVAEAQSAAAPQNDTVSVQPYDGDMPPPLPE